MVKKLPASPGLRKVVLNLQTISPGATRLRYIIAHHYCILPPPREYQLSWTHSSILNHRRCCCSHILSVRTASPSAFSSGLLCGGQFVACLSHCWDTSVALGSALICNPQHWLLAHLWTFNPSCSCFDRTWTGEMH